MVSRNLQEVPTSILWHGNTCLEIGADEATEIASVATPLENSSESEICKRLNTFIVFSKYYAHASFFILSVGFIILPQAK